MTAIIHRSRLVSTGRWLVFVLCALAILSCRAPSFLLNEVAPGREVIRGSGEILRENRLVGDFEHLVITGVGQIWITQGRDESLAVETDENLLPFLETKVTGSTLFIGLTEEAENKNLRPTQGINFYIQLPVLASVEIMGSGDVRADRLVVKRLDIAIYGSGDVDLQVLRVERLDIIVAGSGDVGIGDCECDLVETSIPGSGEIRVAGLEADELEVSISGSGLMELAGRTNWQGINIGGSGNYRGGGLESVETQVRIGGSGKVEIWATEMLDIRISGSGSLRYYGRPQVNQLLSDSGSVTSLGER
jgi:hypothetical protein